MRIAIVTETYPPEINGVALTVHAFVNELARQGHELHLVRPRQAATSAVSAAVTSESTVAARVTASAVRGRGPRSRQARTAASASERGARTGRNASELSIPADLGRSRRLLQ